MVELLDGFPFSVFELSHFLSRSPFLIWVSERIFDSIQELGPSLQVELACWVWGGFLEFVHYRGGPCFDEVTSSHVRQTPANPFQVVVEILGFQPFVDSKVSEESFTVGWFPIELSRRVDFGRAFQNGCGSHW